MLLFDAWNRCNNNCVMCSNPSKMYQNKKNSAFFAKEFIIEKIKKKREELIKTKDSIQLTGGEPTIHPEFLDIIRKIIPVNKKYHVFLLLISKLNLEINGRIKNKIPKPPKIIIQN